MFKSSAAGILGINYPNRTVPQPAEAMQNALKTGSQHQDDVRSRLLLRQGDCWQAALVPHVGRGNGGKMLTEG